MTLAWTLGYPPAYDRAILIPGNAKAPGGYAFRRRKDALEYIRSHPEAARYRPYRIYLPGSFDACTTVRSDCSVLLVEAPFQQERA